jgi:cellulose synthase/poly-beta-1,6-N-acetylglucosamine synthase-like glycosyltransferase
MVLTLFIIAIVCTLIAIHPFVTYPVSLWLIRKMRGEHRGHTARRDERVTFAICMCAYNEERVIEAKVRNLLALREREPGLQIHIYVDAATDRTSEILSRYADTIDLHVSGERHGKT